VRITKCTKAVTYAVLAVCFTVFAVWTVSPLHNAADFVTAYWRSDILLFLTACSVLGVGVYSFWAYTRRRKTHRADSWFFILTGAALLAFSVAVILRFGGITEENFDMAAGAALNLNIGAVSAIPLPFLVRGWILACTARFSHKQRTVAVIAAAIATAVYLAAVISGQLMFRVTPPISENGSVN